MTTRLGIVRPRQEPETMYPETSMRPAKNDAALTGAWLVASRGGIEAEA